MSKHSEPDSHEKLSDDDEQVCECFTCSLIRQLPDKVLPSEVVALSVGLVRAYGLPPELVMVHMVPGIVKASLMNASQFDGDEEQEADPPEDTENSSHLH